MVPSAKRYIFASLLVTTICKPGSIATALKVQVLQLQFHMKDNMCRSKSLNIICWKHTNRGPWFWYLAWSPDLPSHPNRAGNTHFLTHSPTQNHTSPADNENQRTN